MAKKIKQKDTELGEILEAIKPVAEYKVKKRELDAVLDDLDNAFGLTCEIEAREKCWRWNWWIRATASSVLTFATTTAQFDRAMLLVRKTYLLGARRENFDDFCLWMEIDRPQKERFYPKRRKSLLPLVMSLQDLYDGKIKFLGVSMPPRVGKSTMCFFFLAFVFGHRPHTRSLCVGYSTSLAKSFFERVLEFIEGEDYRWADVFPHLNGVSKRSVEDLSFDVKVKPTAFPTCMFRGIDGSLTGSCDCSKGGIQYCDDLVRDYEESLNPARLDILWGKYINQVRDRMHGSMQLMVGTRWNVFDPLGRIRELPGTDKQYRFLIIPALDANDESNFAYESDGYSTEEYRELRRITGPAEWWAKFQGQPYIREGLLFERSALRTYNGVLPDIEPDNIVAAVDVALGGGDSVAMPVGYVYGDDVYIADVVFNNGSTKTTSPLVAGKLIKHKPYMTRFEENSGGKLYKDLVAAILKSKEVKIPITTARAKGEMPKRTRILTTADDIKEHFIFLDAEHQTPEYREFMRELCIYTLNGRNKHDDAPDSLAQLADMLDAKERTARKIGVRRRLF